MQQAFVNKGLVSAPLKRTACKEIPERPQHPPAFPSSALRCVFLPSPRARGDGFQEFSLALSNLLG